MDHTYKVGTRQGYKYSLILVDDHTRVVWVHLMETKHEAYSVITQFINMADTQYNKKMKKVMRSDNALEFKDSIWTILFHSMGIIHETTCVDRPQHNGRAGRRHENLLEMVRASRFQSGLLAQYWGECLLIVVHITNKLNWLLELLTSVTL